MASVVGRKGVLDGKKVAKGVAKHMPFPKHEEGGMALWKKFALFGALPSVGVLTFKTILDVQHQPHEQPEFVAYDHLRIRNKRFPWGDGQKSLFHNPHVNPLPTGFEDH